MNTQELVPDSLKGLLILVVDDEADNIWVIKDLLELNGAEVITAYNGQEGLEMIKHRPHVIITDLAMPVMSGYEMLAALKNDRATAEIPVIALTAHVTDNYRIAAFEAGCHNFLVKPFTMKALVNQVLTLIRDV
jgi:CheY-like chemotaxis protein